MANPDPFDQLDETGWKPTRKLIASTLAGVIVFLLTKFAISVDPIIEQAVNVAVMVAVGYFVPNDKTPGGVPLKKRPRTHKI